MRNYKSRFSILFLLALLFIGAAALSRAVPSLASGKTTDNRPVPHWGTDVHVDTVPADNHEAFSLAYDPSAPNKVVTSFKYEGPQDPSSAYSFSSDAGRTWTGGAFTGPWGQDVVTPTGNTSVGYNAAGVAFLSSRAKSDLSGVSGYFVLTSTDSASWSTPVAVITSTYAEVRDQARLAVDRRATGQYAGQAYLAWHYSSGNDVGIFVSHSSDSGLTWSSAKQVSDPANNYSSHPVLDIASDGSVYAAYMRLENGCFCQPPGLLVNHSTDGGETWGGDHPVSGATVVPVGALDVEGHDLVLRGADTPEAGVEVNNFPVMAVSPSSPNIAYVAWNDGRWDTGFQIYGHAGQHGDIAFSRSTDSGVTWSAPIRVNDDQLGNGIDQFMPAIAVGPDGTIGISWYDRRLNPAQYLYDVFYSQSRDGGLTWSRNQRVSSASSDPMVAPNAEGVGDLGQYRSMVMGPNFVLPTWLDTRTSQTQEFYIGLGNAPACNLSFSDVNSTDYFYSAVEYLSCQAAISGYPDGTFRPYDNTTRGQLAKIVTLAEGWQVQNPSTGHFLDVLPGSTFYEYVETMYAQNVISGYPDGTFRPGAQVTRGQAAKIVVLSAGWTIDVTGGPHFNDVAPDSTFYTYVETAYNHGVISGYPDGTFRPGNSATRGQISKIVYNAVAFP
jgi:S-layer homology domain